MPNKFVVKFLKLDIYEILYKIIVILKIGASIINIVDADQTAPVVFILDLYFNVYCISFRLRMV